MAENKNVNNDDLKISWLGIDGLLCVCFVLESIFIGYCMIHNVDFVLGKVLPYAATLITLWIFLKYISQVIAFSKGTRKK